MAWCIPRTAQSGSPTPLRRLGWTTKASACPNPHNSPRPFIKEAVYRMDMASGRSQGRRRAVQAQRPLLLPRLLAASTSPTPARPATTRGRRTSSGNGTWTARALPQPARHFRRHDPAGSAASPTASAADENGNVWAGAGWVGDGYDGVLSMPPAPTAQRIGLNTACPRSAPTSASAAPGDQLFTDGRASRSTWCRWTPRGAFLLSESWQRRLFSPPSRQASGPRTEGSPALRSVTLSRPVAHCIPG